jgi:hypothetical protein
MRYLDPRNIKPIAARSNANFAAIIVAPILSAALMAAPPDDHSCHHA